MRVLLWRLFLAKLLNVIIQVFSFSLLLDPYFLVNQSLPFGISGSKIRRETEVRARIQTPIDRDPVRIFFYAYRFLESGEERHLNRKMVAIKVL